MLWQVCFSAGGKAAQEGGMWDSCIPGEEVGEAGDVVATLL